MNRINRVFILLVLIAFIFFQGIDCASAELENIGFNYKPDCFLRSILVTGDSIVEGEGDNQWGGWPNRIKRKLGNHLLVSIRGVAGDNILGLEDRISFELKEANPQILIVGIGINDSQFRPSMGRNDVEIHEFENALSRIINTAWQEGVCQVFIVGLTRANEKKTNPYEPDHIYLNKYIKLYDFALKKVACDKHVYYIEVANFVDPRKNRSSIASDGLHPSSLGHYFIADLILKKINL